jgi:hypothetical protein
MSKENVKFNSLYINLESSLHINLESSPKKSNLRYALTFHWTPILTLQVWTICLYLLFFVLPNNLGTLFLPKKKYILPTMLLYRRAIPYHFKGYTLYLFHICYFHCIFYTSFNQFWIGNYGPNLKELSDLINKEYRLNRQICEAQTTKHPTSLDLH